MPASKSTSLTSTTARLLRARPWLAPALGVLVLLAGGSAWWLLSPPAREGPLVRDVKIEPGLRRVRVSFATQRPVRVMVEVAPATPATKLPAPGEAATEHRLEITGLAESTEHRLTVTIEGARRLTLPFRTQTLLVEHLRKVPHLNALDLSWTTSLPVRSRIVYAPKGGAELELAVDEPLGTVHTARIGGLSRDRDYEITLISTTAHGEVHRLPPFDVKLFASAAAEALALIERAEVSRRILELLSTVSKAPDRAQLQAMLSEKLDPVRAPLSVVRGISREFFDSPDVDVKSKLKVYTALKMIEHLERLAQVRKLPLLELLAPFDWGSYRQIAVSFDDAKLPLPLPRVNRDHPNYPTPAYFTDPALLPGIAVDQQPASPDGRKWLTEWRPNQIEHDAIAVLGRDADGEQELEFRFALADPTRVRAAELWLAYSDCSPLQFFELELNGAAPLVLRPPLAMEKHHWYRDGLRLDPALLTAGQNVVKLRLKPIPQMLVGRRLQVWYLELRTLRKRS